MYIVADIGGTNTRITSCKNLEAFGEPSIYDTPHDYDTGIATLIEHAREHAAGEPIDRMMVGIPGTQSSDHRCTFISGTGTLAGWSKQAIADDLEKALNAKVWMENDAALCGLGEAVYGAGKGAGIVAYFTVSTGVGAVRILDQRIERMVYGAEVGGQYLSVAHDKTLEQLVSGTAVYEAYGVHPRELGKESPVWEELAQVLAVGVYNSLLHWSPERVVFGGSMFNEIGISVDRVRAHVEEINVKLPAVPEFVHSALGNIGGLWGGLARLKQF
jgi:predicted NBD/HSP70 family sugar kinase